MGNKPVGAAAAMNTAMRAYQRQFDPQYVEGDLKTSGGAAMLNLYAAQEWLGKQIPQSVVDAVPKGKAFPLRNMPAPCSEFVQSLVAENKNLDRATGLAWAASDGFIRNLNDGIEIFFKDASGNVVAMIGADEKGQIVNAEGLDGSSESIWKNFAAVGKTLYGDSSAKWKGIETTTGEGEQVYSNGEISRVPKNTVFKASVEEKRTTNVANTSASTAHIEYFED